MMDKFLLKVISVFISAITLCSCDYGGGDYNRCTSTQDEVFVLKDTDFLSFPFAHQPELVFLYNADSGLTIPHQFKLTNTGVADDLQIVTVNDDYEYCDFEVDIHFKRRIFVNDL